MAKYLLLLLGLILSLGGNALRAQGYKGSHYYHQRLSLFESLPVERGAIVFLGNSITDGGEWAELFPKAKRVLNRGISGDVTAGILNRVGEVVRHQPKKVFLLIGINDLSHSITPEKVLGNILSIVTRIQEGSPRTKVYVQSILPVNDSFRKFAGHIGKGESVRAINAQLRDKANELRYTFIDLHTHFSDAEGQLRPEYTNDGLHLLGAGYQRWAELIRPYITSK